MREKFLSGRSRQVVMIGTAPEGKGGVAAVVSVYKNHGLFDRFGIRYVATHRGGSMLQKLWCGLSGGLQLLWLLMNHRVALVHAQVASYGSFKRKSIYLGLARAFGVDTVFHLHGAEFKKFTDEIASAALRRRIVNTIRSSTRVIALSDSWADYLRSIAPGAQVLAVANPVHMPASVSHEHELQGRVLFLGRAEQRKGVFDLLEAFAKVSARVPQARLAIGGDGDLTKVRERIQKLNLADRVEVLGWVAGADKDAQMQRAQVFVLPSYDEGLPMAMLEAMAQGKAIVVTPVGGIPEAVQNGQQGLLVTPGAVDELAQALESLLLAPELRQQLGSAARRRVAERFSTEHVLGLVGGLYQDLGIQPVEAGREQR